MRGKKHKRRPQGRVYRERSSPEKGARDKPILALLKVDPGKGVSEEEFRLFMRELGLPETKD